MCTNATKTAASLMAAIEPTLKSILTFTNLINTPQGQDAIKAYEMRPWRRCRHGRASPEESHAMHQAHVIADTTAKVTTLVPGFKRSIWHSPASQYAKAWNEGVTSSGLPDELKTAA